MTPGKTTEQDLRAHARQRELSEWLVFTDDVGRNLGILEETLEPAFNRVESRAEAAVLHFSLTQKNGYIARALRDSDEERLVAMAQQILANADRLMKAWKLKV